MTVAIRSVRADWEGMAYIALHGSLDGFRNLSIGEPLNGYKDSFVLLKNAESKACGAILASLVEDRDEYIEIDPCLLSDLSSEPGKSVEITALEPRAATSVRVALSKTDLNKRELESLSKTYLDRHPLSTGQKKHIYLFTGERIAIEVLEVAPCEFAIFSNATQLVVEEGRSTASISSLEEVGGLENEKRIIRERILLPIVQPEYFAAHGIRPPRGILLCGPPGCGKTMIARGLSSEINANFVELNGSEVFNPLYGESEKVLREAFEKARKKTPAIILIDEIDTLGGARSATRGDLERRLVNTLLTEMDGLRSLGNVVVVATTNTPDSLDPALRRPGRFDYEIQIGVPDRKGRREILDKLTKHMAIDEDIDLDDLARRTHGFVGADLMLLCREAAFEGLTTRRTMDELSMAKPESMAGTRISKADFENALKRVRPSALREFAVEVPSNLGWIDVGGLQGIKDTMIQEVVQILRDPESFEEVGISPVKGILLYGPPGTGKTLIARIIANEAEANFMSIKGPELLSKWFGESEQRIRSLFSKAREASPCIIFFDEIDAISSARGSLHSDAGDRVVNQLLTEMDGFQTGKHVCVIAATNRAELIDPALLRPGRFDYQILVPLPDEAGREDIFKIHLRSKPTADNIDLRTCVSQSKLFSGAHIAEVCRRAALAAFRENHFKASDTRVTMKHILEAIDVVGDTIRDVERPGVGFLAGRET
ncbi:MAG: AAA family ATPase [Candidatus Aquicultorales bacterium]